MIRKIQITVLSLIFIFNFLSAKQISQKDAETVANNFLQKKAIASGNSPEVELSYIEKGTSTAGDARNYFFVFNIKNGYGFIIVSGDDVAWPVLGYAADGHADATNLPWSVAKWLGGYKSDIQFALDNQTPQAELCKLEWMKYLDPTAHIVNTRAGSVSALLTTKWNQSPNYNAQCPYDNASSQRTVVGCVATAMAQIIKYHGYPTQGTGFHSYSHSKYGTLSANFASATYDYANMPSTINSANTAVATLSYHCGVSVDMNYGIGSTGGSGAYVISSQSPYTHCAEYALEEYFGYKTSLSGVERVNYTTSSWKTMLKAECDAARPVLYAGFGSGGGHCFVLDGYDNADYFHFNWGWGGSYDGYFSIDALNPSGVGTGGGSGGFNSGHQAVIGIEAPSGGGNTGKYDLVLYNDLNISSTTVDFAGPFSITTNIYNKGTSSFSGDYGMAVFDDKSNFVDFVETKTGMSLNNGYVYKTDLTFSTTGNVKFLPGNYSAILYYRPTSGDWSALGYYNNHYNEVAFSIVYENDIELYSNITFGSGSSTITRKKSITVNLDIANYKATTVSGTIDVSLYDLEGKFVETVNSQAFSLPTLSHFTGGLNFTLSAGLQAAAGSYLIAAVYKTASGSWTLVGSKDYQNPTRITLQDPAVTPDNYETNNVVAEAYTLSSSYTSNQATVLTTGSNFHIGTDYDFYKINLPAGYDYTVKARIHDASDAGNGNTYTVDGVLSISADGSIFSEAYDYIMPSAMSIKNGGVFYVKVSPYFTGNEGTYLLDVNITRTPILNQVAGIYKSEINLFPNPTSGSFKIQSANNIQSVEVISLDGKTIGKVSNFENAQEAVLSSADWAAGSYFVRVICAGKVEVKLLKVVK